MARVSTTILVVLVLMNGTAGIMDASGLSDDLGVELSTGVSDALDNAMHQASCSFDDGTTTSDDCGFAPGTGVGSTLFGLFVSALYFAQAVFQAVFAAPSMFMNLGFPSWFVTPIFAPMYIVAALELLYTATGRDLT